MERTRTEIVEFLHGVERKFPVNSWKYQGHCLWPYVRIKLFFALLKSDDTSDDQAATTRESMWYKLLTSIPEFVRIYWGRGKAPHLYCGASHFKQWDNGTYKTRYFNQLIAASEKAGEQFLLLEYESSVREYEKKVDHPDRTLHFHKISPLLHLWKRVKLIFATPEITAVGELRDLLSELEVFSGGKVRITVADLQEELTYMTIVNDLYRRILLNYQVKEVFVLCYYNRIMFPMILAAHELGIPTVDIQHGGQGEEHMAYANFNVVPSMGYSALPAVFWCWDEGSAEVLRQWMRKQDYHKVWVKGNPWLDFQKETQQETLDETRRIILYTLQPEGGEILDPYIVEAIRKTSTGFVWWLRLHPRQMNRKKELSRLLRKNEVENKVVVEEASNYSLPFLLGQSYVHISKYSGSILEAYLLNKRTIIISEMGVKMFPEVVNSDLGYVLTQPDSNALLSTIYSVGQAEHNFVK